MILALLVKFREELAPSVLLETVEVRYRGIEEVFAPLILRAALLINVRPSLDVVLCLETEPKVPYSV